MGKMTAAVAAAALFLATAPSAYAQMTVSSEEIKDGGASAKPQEANVFGCDGENISPSVKWTGAPEGTKSFAVNLFDRDAPTGSGFWHWVVFNIPPSTTSLPADAGDMKKNLMPKGVIQSRNDFGFTGYGGMCPPQGDKPHHYTLTVYAVDEETLQYAKDDMVSPAVVGFELHFHTKAKGALEWTYSRPK